MRIFKADDETVLTTGASATFPNGKYRHGVGGVKKGEEATRLEGGPKIKGPWAYTYGLATCIAANPKMGTGYIAEQGRLAGTEFAVETGDLVEYDGNLYEVETFRNEEYVNLHRMNITRNRKDADSRKYPNQLEMEQNEREAVRARKVLDAHDVAAVRRRNSNFTASKG